MTNKSYTERHIELDLPCLVTRRIRGDQIEVYKQLHNKYDSTVNTDLIQLNRRENTRNNGLKIEKQNSRINSRRYFFTLRTVNMWNRLDAEVVNAPFLNSFKQKLDKHLKDEGIYYDIDKSLDFLMENS